MHDSLSSNSTPVIPPNPFPTVSAVFPGGDASDKAPERNDRSEECRMPKPGVPREHVLMPGRARLALKLMVLLQLRRRSVCPLLAVPPPVDSAARLHVMLEEG